MSFPQDLPPDYIIYCDESGDPGRTERASDWFVVSGVLVKANREPEIESWIEAIKRPLGNRGRPDLHFYKLDDRMRFRASRMLGKLPVRCFSIVSHKANMKGYRNRRVERRYDWRNYEADGTTWTINPRNAWFHNWLLKLLLERVTAYCANRSLREGGELRTVRIVIARKGGFYLSDFSAYLYVDRTQASADSGTLGRYLDWRVVDLKQIECVKAVHTPGLQLADIVCGSLLRAVDFHRFGKCDMTHFRNLRPRMALSPQNTPLDFSFMAWPRPLWKANLGDEQLSAFREWGYEDEWLVRPGPRSAGEW